MKQFLILTPLMAESDLLLLGWRELGLEQQSLDGNHGRLIKLPELGLICAIGGHGKVEFALRTAHYISQFPTAAGVLCAGCAGGLNPIVHPGDVIIGTQTIEHDYRLKFIQRPLPSFAAASALIAMFKEVRSPQPPDYSVHFGAIASGDEDIVEPNRAHELFTSTGALAVGWEGAGGARACQFHQRPYLEIRAVTDRANHTAQTDFQQNLQRAMANLAHYLAEIFKPRN